MGAEEGDPVASGAEGTDAVRPVSNTDAAELATPAEPDDEQMVTATDNPATGQVSILEVEKADAAAEAAQQSKKEGAEQHTSDHEKAAQVDQEGDTADAPEQAGAGPADQPLEVAIGGADFIKAADSQRVVWARVKGFPHWPAQIMTEKEAAVRMEHVFRPSPLSLPVMFFGTLEIAWMAPAEVVSWAEGVEANFLKKNKARRKFLKSVEEVHLFLAPGPQRRKAPEGWWKKAINPPKPKSKETVLEIGAAANHTQAAKAGATKGAKGASKAGNGLGVHTNSKVVKRVQRPVKRIDGADEDDLKELLGDEGEADLAAAPKRKPSAGRRPDFSAPKPPHYEAVRRNLWTSRSRPKRLPKDDIPVCGCTPPPRPPAAAAPQLPPSSSAAPPAVLPLQHQPGDAAPAPADAGVPGSTPPAELATAPHGDADEHADAPASGDADAPMTFRALQPLANGVAALAGAEEALAAEAHAPIAVPRPSAMLVPPAAVANAAKAAMPERTGCGENCLNRLSYIHCDPKQCPCGDYCSNRPFHLLPQPKTELFLTEDRGWGVKATEHIPRGTFIVEYAGEVIEEHECRRRMAQAKVTGLQHFYMMELAPGLIIDARVKGNMARFINSSCAPNCESQKWHDAATGEIRIGIFAADDIEPGTELAYDYQFQHAGLAQDAGAYRCMCGAPNCRGTMDTQPERFKDFGKRVEVFWDGDSVFYRGTVTAYSTTSGKHTILYDDNDVERVCLKTVKHRWLDESAPMKMSPLHAALVAQSGLLGPEPLDLNAGPEPEIPQAAMEEPQPKAAAQVQPEIPQAAAEEAQPMEVAQVQPEVEAQIPAEPPAVEEAALAVAFVVPPPAANGELSTAAAAPARPVRKSRAASAGRGLKRKQAEGATEEEIAEALKDDEDALAAQGAHVPKHKMWLKRCQRDSQEQEAPPAGPALQPQLAPAALSWAVPDPAAAAQLTANAGAPPQLPAPFNAPPFAMPPFPLPSMPPGLPGQNALQVAMYQMLLMSNPQLAQAHKTLGGSLPSPHMPMASLHQMFATFANAAAAASAPALVPPLAPWLPGVAGQVPPGSQMLPQVAPLQLGPLTPAGAASGPAQPPSVPMTPNLWGAMPPGYAPQMPPAWPPVSDSAGPSAAPLPQSAAVAPASVGARAQLPNGDAKEVTAPATALEHAGGSTVAASEPAEQSSLDGAASAAALEAEQDALFAAAVAAAAAKHQFSSEGAAPEAAGPAKEPDVADAPAAAPVDPSPQADSAPSPAAEQPAVQEPASATEAEGLHDSSEASAAEAAMAEQASAVEEEQPKHAESQEDTSADGHAVLMAVDDCAAAPSQADTGSAVPTAEPATDAATAADSEAPAQAAADADAPHDIPPALPGEEEVQKSPDNQSQLAAEAGAALIGSVREEATGTPGNAALEESKEQSQLAADAGAALVGNVQQATTGGEEPPQAPTVDADTYVLPSKAADAGAAEADAGGQPSSSAATEAERSSEPPAVRPLADASPPLLQRPKAQQRLFDPTTALSNGHISPANGTPKAAPQGLIDPVSVGPAAAAVAPAAAPEAEADEAELWGSLLVDSPSPCKAPKAAWAQDPSLWRANGPGPARPPLGQ